MFLGGLLPDFLWTPPHSPPSFFSRHSNQAVLTQSIQGSGQAKRAVYTDVILGSALSLATPGDCISNPKVLIKFLTGSASSEAQTHPTHREDPLNH